MATGWLTDDEVRDAVRAFAHVGGGNVTDSLLGAVPWATAQARAQLEGHWVAKGYSTAQVASWDYVRQYHERQSLYWIGQRTRGAVAVQVSDPLDKMNAMGEVAALAALVIGGVVVNPASTAVVAATGIASGTLADRAAFDADRTRERGGRDKYQW